MAHDISVSVVAQVGVSRGLAQQGLLAIEWQCMHLEIADLQRRIIPAECHDASESECQERRRKIRTKHTASGYLGHDDQRVRRKGHERRQVPMIPMAVRDEDGIDKTVDLGTQEVTA